MGYYQTNEFRKGLRILIDGDDQPYEIVDNTFVKPGKGQAFSRVKIKNMMSGNVIERTYKSGEKVSSADVEERTMQYLYNDGQEWTFMDSESYDQVSITGKQLGDSWKWLQEQKDAEVVFYKGLPISIELPNFTVLKITECDPGVKGNTVTGATKPATLETGAVVSVPLFIEAGESIKVDTRNGEYIERAKV